MDATVRIRRVLVVDDNRDAAESLAMLLEEMGHHVRHTTDPRKASGIAGEFVPEIAFLDIGMPHVDGYELALRLKAEPALRETLLVAVTAYGAPEDRVQSRKAGFDAHVQKPMDAKLLQSILEQFPVR